MITANTPNKAAAADDVRSYEANLFSTLKHDQPWVIGRKVIEAFYEREVHFRRSMRYPPFVAMINVVVRARTFAGAMDDAGDLVERLRQAEAESGFRVLGPAPAPLGKLRGEYRAQLLIKGTHRKRMREALMCVLAERPDLARRTVVDVDPLSVL